MKFNELNIINEILTALQEKNYEVATPIQEKAIPFILNNKDLLACAQTGTGKTAAFAIPIIQKLAAEKHDNKTKALILTPTRELALQIRDNFRVYGKNTKLSCSVIFGGVNQASQIKVLEKGVDILVATPGRLLDLINQRYAKLDNVKYLVLDEADTMLDMGFIHDVKRIISKIPSERQTLLFSATMPTEIEKLAQEFLKNPERVIVNPVSTTVDKIDQTVYYIDKFNKNNLLLDILKEDMQTLIFTRTKHGANKLSDFLNQNKISAAAIHGNKSQSAREGALANFKKNRISVLVATDIAARGIDIKNLPRVINYEIPNISETYVHRIGRTARAGMEGHAISFCSIDELKDFKQIEKLIKKEVREIKDHEYPMKNLQVTETKKPNNRQKNTKKDQPRENRNFKKNTEKAPFNKKENSTEFKKKRNNKNSSYKENKKEQYGKKKDYRSKKNEGFKKYSKNKRA